MKRVDDITVEELGAGANIRFKWINVNNAVKHNVFPGYFFYRRWNVLERSVHAYQGKFED